MRRSLRRTFFRPERPTLTSRSLQSITRPFQKRFREVFGNARILIFYLSIKAWEEKSLPKFHLGWFFLVFGEGKATKENMSIFWFIWPLTKQSIWGQTPELFITVYWNQNIVLLHVNTCILGRMYFVEHSIHLIKEHWLFIITGVQASGVFIDRLLRQCCFLWSEIVGPHSSGNFNDWPLKLKAGCKYRDALRASI